MDQKLLVQPISQNIAQQGLNIIMWIPTVKALKIKFEAFKNAKSEAEKRNVPMGEGFHRCETIEVIHFLYTFNQRFRCFEPHRFYEMNVYHFCDHCVQIDLRTPWFLRRRQVGFVSGHHMFSKSVHHYLVGDRFKGLKRLPTIDHLENVIHIVFGFTVVDFDLDLYLFRNVFQHHIPVLSI